MGVRSVKMTSKQSWPGPFIHFSAYRSLSSPSTLDIVRNRWTLTRREYRSAMFSMHSRTFPIDRSGRFKGNYKISPIEPNDGIHWIVQKEFSYSDAYGHTLTAEQGFSTDGASIPRALWTFVGSPFTSVEPTKKCTFACIHRGSVRSPLSRP